MNQIKKINVKELIIVFSVSLLIALLNIFKIILGALQTTKDTVYLAIGHYLPDYLGSYILSIAQGIHGHWMIKNFFSSNDQSQTFIGFGPYLLMGKLAKIFNWSPYFTYWFAVFVLTVIICLLSFYLIKKLLPNEKIYFQISAWLLSLFATPFIKIIYTNNNYRIIPYDYWYAPMSIFHRFGNIPHHTLSTILIVLILLLINEIISNLNGLNWTQLLKKTIFICFLLIFMLTFVPFQVINLMSSLFIVSWIYFNVYLLKNNKKSILKFIVFLGLTTTIVLSSAIYIKISIQSIDYLKSTSVWEMSQQYYPGFLEFFAVTGPILIFIPFGIKAFFKSTTPLRLLFFFYVFFCYVYYYSPLAVLLGSHNGRFVNPNVYTLFGVLTIFGMKTVTSKLTKKPILLTCLLVIFLSYFLIVTAVIYKSSPEVDKFSYLPKELIMGIKVFDQQPDKKVVLTSPTQPLFLVIPIIVDRRVFSTFDFSSIVSENKKTLVNQFYKGTMTVGQAKKFFLKNNIGYVILSSFDDNFKANTLEVYSFLIKIYENKTVKIFKVL